MRCYFLYGTDNVNVYLEGLHLEPAQSTLCATLLKAVCLLRNSLPDCARTWGMFYKIYQKVCHVAVYLI